MGGGSAIERVGRYWYFVDHLVPEEGAVVRLWVGLPMNRPGQAVTLGAISPEPVRIHEDDDTDLAMDSEAGSLVLSSAGHIHDVAGQNPSFAHVEASCQKEQEYLRF